LQCSAVAVQLALSELLNWRCFPSSLIIQVYRYLLEEVWLFPGLALLVVWGGFA